MKQTGKRKLPPKRSDRTSPVAVDLFAGGGGLTLGLKLAGFNVAAAVENEPHALATYRANHPEVHLLPDDIRTVSGQSLLETSPSGGIDLLCGCPPCQGFTSLTSKYRKIDKRNVLIREMGRIIRETRPRAVMLENVPGLISKGRTLLIEFLDTLGDLGYAISLDILQVANYGIPQSRRRLVLLAGQGFPIPIPEPTHSRTGLKQLTPWITIRQALPKLPKPLTLGQTNALGGPATVNWHVVRTLSPRNRARLAAAKPAKGWTTLPKRLRPTCHQDESSGFPNVYGRMAWNRVAPTITAGFSTLSKGRFGHPERQRTISVREGATLQTFPVDYIFDTPRMERVCEIIGNALPPTFAEILSRRCYEALTVTS